MFLLTTVVVLSLGGVHAMSAANGHSQAEPETAKLVALEKAFEDAIVTADVKALGEIVGDDWIVIGPDGAVVTRAAFFDIIRSGALTHSTMESSEERVRIYENTAIVTVRVVSAGAYEGQGFRTIERSTDVFVRTQGSWQCVLTQLTSIFTK